MTKEDIEHEDTDEIICPYCGYEHQDSCDLNMENGETDVIECKNCGQDFSVICDISYSTQKINDSLFFLKKQRK